MKKTYEILERAASLIEERGLTTRGYLHSPSGCLCTLGAVLTATNISTDEWKEEYEELPQIQAVGLALSLHYPRFKSVSNWNDKKGRKKKDAIFLLRKAAEYEREREKEGWY